jgi:hypothetical protein
MSSFQSSGCGQTPGIFQRVHFPMLNGATLLHAAIVTSTQNFALMYFVLVYQDRPDGNAAFPRAKPRFMDGSFQEFKVIGILW